MSLTILAGANEQSDYIKNLKGTKEKFLPDFDLVVVEPESMDTHILKADEHASDETTHILHVAEDSIFTGEYSQNLIFKDEKVIMPYTPYDTLLSQELPEGMHEGLAKCKQGVSDLLNCEVEHEFARRLPITYPVKLYKGLRVYIEENQGMSLDDAVHAYDVGSVYNLLGAYAWQNNKDLFHWVNTEENQLDDLPFIQSTRDKDFVIIL